MRHGSSINRTQVIERHFTALIQETSTTEYGFAASVRAHYEAAVHEVCRTIEFSQVRDPFLRMKRDAEKIKRWFDPSANVRLPDEIVESIFAAFPVQRRFALQADLLARQGLLAVPMPSADYSAETNLGHIGKETGEAIMKVAELLEDGLNQNDADKAPEAIREINEAIAVLAAMKHRIEVEVTRPAPVTTDDQEQPAAKH